MPEQILIDRLDDAVEAMLRRPQDERVPEDPELAALWRVAADLVDVPAEGFRARLAADLKRRATMSTETATAAPVNYAIPNLSVRGAAAAIDFYKRAFGAVELFRLAQPDGKVGHAEIAIEGAPIYLADEFPDYGFVGPQTLGGSSVLIHLYVDDVDAFVARAAAAGATVERPPTDEFYGERVAKVKDPFGHAWMFTTTKEDLSNAQVERRYAEELEKEAAKAPKPVKPIPEGFRSLTPYLVVQGAGRLIDFMKQAFGAEERLRVNLPDGKVQHAEVKIGDSIVELGDGGGAWPGRPSAIHLYVDDADATYARAVAAGALTLIAPMDMPYGDREADVKDPFGNNWYIGTRKQGGPIPAGMHTVTPTLHVEGTDRLIDFIKQAFGAEELDRTLTPAGVVMHAQLKVGDSVLELGEPSPGFIAPMPCAIHHYVEDADAVYARALRAGATTIGEPSDRPYGDRAAEVADPFGNHWFIATRISETR